MGATERDSIRAVADLGIHVGGLLQDPRNCQGSDPSLAVQYDWLFDLDGADLKFTDEVVAAIVCEVQSTAAISGRLTPS